MTISPKDIEVGRCYLMEDGSIRRVTSTGSDGLVRYWERVGPELRLGTGTKKRRRHDFADQALREVPCDWAPDGEERP